MADIEMIEAKYHALSSRLDEAALRIWAATEARSLGCGGVSMVAKAIGMSRTTIYAGLSEPKAPSPTTGSKSNSRPRVRAVGGGRKRLADKDANLVSALDALVEPTTRGDLMSPLRWTTKSTYRLSDELKHQGHDVSQRTVCDLLAQMGFSLQSTRKTREGGDHEDRDARFAHIARTVADYQATGDPVISVLTG
jgi:transposase